MWRASARALAWKKLGVVISKRAGPTRKKEVLMVGAPIAIRHVLPIPNAKRIIARGIREGLEDTFATLSPLDPLFLAASCRAGGLTVTHDSARRRR